MRIRLTPEADQKISLYIKHAEGEISGLGRATLSPDRSELVITDAYIWEQTASATATEVIDHDSVFNLAVELEKKGIPVDELCVWWHSHAKMEALFSGTDKDTISQWVNNRFLCALIGNKKGEYTATIAVKEPIACTIDDVPVIVGSEVDPRLDEKIKNEVAEKVKVQVYDHAKINSDWYGWPKNQTNQIADYSSRTADNDYRLLTDCMCSVCREELSDTEYGAIKDPEFDIDSHLLDRTTKMWQPLYE